MNLRNLLVEEIDTVLNGTVLADRELAECIADRVLAVLPEQDFRKARRTDPQTAVDAAQVVKARATTHRVRLLEAFGRAEPWGTISDEQAAEEAGIDLRSEYATRCSELRSARLIEATEHTVLSRSGQSRITSRITDLGRDVLLTRRLRDDS